MRIYKKNIFLIILCFLSLIAVPLTASQKLLKKDNVKEIMNDLLVYHVEHKEMNTEVMKRSFRIYLERFDVLKYYLTTAEIKAFLNPSEQMLQDAVKRYYKGDLHYHEQIQAMVEMAILRARKNRELMRFDAERNVMSQRVSSLGSLSSISFSKDVSDLTKRQKQHMERFVMVQERSTPFVATTSDYQKMFDYYESRMREYESNYLADAEDLPNGAQSEHNLSFHTLKSLTKSLDTHTEYFSPDETRMMQNSLSKAFYGVGLVLQRDYRGITVHEVTKNGPADKTGHLKVGDEVYAINNHELKSMKYKEIIELLHGGEKAELKLAIRRADANGKLKEKDILVKREKVGLSNRLIEVDYEPYQGGIIGKITLNSFYDNQAGVSSRKDIEKALVDLRSKGELKGLVLDFRENPGGYLMQAVEVAGLFISNGVVAAAKFADGKVHYLRDLDGKRQYSGPLVILTSRLSASSSEIVVGTLKDYGVAVVVGDPQTYGKGSIQYQTLTLPNPKHYYKVTIGRYYTVSGKCTQLDGVKADIVLPSHYYYEKLGERFVASPLGRDQIPPAYNDTLSDLDARAKDIFTRFYLPTLQKKTDTWTNMIPALQKKSADRLKKNQEFQSYLKKLENNDPKAQSSVVEKNDMQMQEATFIVKDMIEIKKSSRVSEVVLSQ